MRRIEITRAEFELKYGFKPDPSTMGMMFFTPDGKEPIAEVVFTDEVPGEVVLEIAELERMYAL